MTDAGNQVEYGGPPVALPSRVSQGTAIEQSRAVAEVQAQVIVAQQCPRSLGAARTLMQESCKLLSVADSAFYRFPRGGTMVDGPTIHLMRELARCFQNVQYGIVEMRRDTIAGESEMLAFAWDVQTNVRASTSFLVPHRRDKTGDDGKPTHDPLIADRDIYENNANQGGRRVRQMISNILPPNFKQEAIDICKETLERGDSAKTIDERRAGAVAIFEGLGVSEDRLVQKIGRDVNRWDGYDLSQLRIIHRSIERNEITVEDEFPPPRVTVAEIHQNAESANQGAEDAAAGEDPPAPAEPAPASGGGAEGEPAGHPTEPPTRSAFEKLSAPAKRRNQMMRAVQAAPQFEDRKGDLSTVDGIYADPEALDAALKWLEENPK